MRSADFDDDRPYEREFQGIKNFEPISRSHEGFVDILQVGRNDAAGFFYYAMELADPIAIGAATYKPKTLAAEAKLRGALRAHEALPMALTLTRALDELHRHKLVHRDIKPSNIIFIDGVAKLADVGLVSAATESRSFVGTEGFIPPEGPGTPQADLYSLGIVLYVVLTGRSSRDFPEPPEDLATRTDREEYLELNAIIHRACRASLRDRYHSSAAMLADLERFAKGKSVRRAHKLEQHWLLARRFLWIGAAATAIYLLEQRIKPSVTARPEKLSSSAEANRSYDLGRLYFQQTTGLGFKKAAEKLEQSIRLDPTFAQAYGLLSVTYTWSIDGWSDNCWSNLPKARETALKALALDKSLPEPHLALGMFKAMREWNWSEAESEFRHATQIDSSKAVFHYFLAECLRMRGRMDEAVIEMNRAFNLDRLSACNNARLADFLICARRYEEAITQADQAIAMEPNSHSYGWPFRIRALCVLGRYAEAIESEKPFRIAWGNPPEKVEREIAELRSAFQVDGPKAYWRDVLSQCGDEDFYWRARAYAQLGEREKAMESLQKAAKTMDAWLTFYVMTDYTLDPVREDTRFHTILRAMHLE